MEDEATDTVRLGVEIIAAAVFVAMVVSIALVSRRWYGKEEYHKYQTRYMTETAPGWTFESAAANGTTLSGNDIMNFVVKNDTKYEYVIGTGKFRKGADKNDLSLLKAPDKSIKKINGLYDFSSYDLVAPSDNPSGAKTEVRIYGIEYIKKMINNGTDPLYIYSEPYLLNTAGLAEHLENRFRVYTDTNNEEIIRYYFLMDPDVKSPEEEVR